MKQNKVSTNRGRDTHVRDHTQNIFTPQNHSTTQMLVGEVLFPEPEPLFKQTMVSVKLARGGTIKHVAYPGAFIDPLTGNIHGTYEGPHPGQMVAVGFENGNSANPFVVNRYPYQGRGNTFVEGKYTLPMTKAGYHNFDVIMGHFTGSFLSLNTGILPSTKLPGSVTLNAMTDFDLTSNTNILLDSLVSAEMKSAVAKLTGTVSAAISAPQVKIDGTATVEINGNTKQFVTFLELNTALQLFIVALNAALGSKLDGGGTPGALVLDITASQTIKTLTGG